MATWQTCFLVFFVTPGWLSPLSHKIQTSSIVPVQGSPFSPGAFGVLHIRNEKNLKGTRFMSTKPFSEIPPKAKDVKEAKEELKEKKKRKKKKKKTTKTKNRKKKRKIKKKRNIKKRKNKRSRKKSPRKSLRK